MYVALLDGDPRGARGRSRNPSRGRSTVSCAPSTTTSDRSATAASPTDIRSPSSIPLCGAAEGGRAESPGDWKSSAPWGRRPGRTQGGATLSLRSGNASQISRSPSYRRSQHAHDADRSPLDVGGHVAASAGRLGAGCTRAQQSQSFAPRVETRIALHSAQSGSGAVTGRPPRHRRRAGAAPRVAVAKSAGSVRAHRRHVAVPSPLRIRLMCRHGSRFRRRLGRLALGRLAAGGSHQSARPVASRNADRASARRQNSARSASVNGEHHPGQVGAQASDLRLQLSARP